MREMLTIIIVLLIAAVVLDGLRRYRRSKKGSIRMSSLGGGEESGSESYGSELPNGGARVIGTREEQEAEEITRNVQTSYAKSRVTMGAKPLEIPEQVSLNLEEEVPLLMESVESQEPDQQGLFTAVPEEEKDFQELENIFAEADLRAEPEIGDVPEELVENITAEASESEEPYVSQSKPLEDLDPLFDEIPDSESEARHEPASEPVMTEPAPAVAEGASSSAEVNKNPQEVLIINIMAPTGQLFEGKRLLGEFNKSGMRFGDMDIFHCYDDAQGQGEVLFSVVNMVAPGTFDTANEDSFNTPGISLFMTLPLKNDSMRAFEVMETVAKVMAHNLGGELKDEHRSVMTAQTLEHCRQRIREFERKRRLAELAAN